MCRGFFLRVFSAEQIYVSLCKGSSYPIMVLASSLEAIIYQLSTELTEYYGVWWVWATGRQGLTPAPSPCSLGEFIGLTLHCLSKLNEILLPCHLLDHGTSLFLCLTPAETGLGKIGS